MAKIFRVAGMALLLWIVPSAASLHFYDRSGKLNAGAVLFSSVITAALSILSSCLLFRYCRSITRHCPWEGSFTGIILFLLS